MTPGAAFFLGLMTGVVLTVGAAAIAVALEESDRRGAGQPQPIKFRPAPVGHGAAGDPPTGTLPPDETPAGADGN